MGILAVATVAHGSLADTAGLLHSLDTNFELVNVVEGIEDSENINTVILGLFDEVVNGVIG